MQDFKKLLGKSLAKNKIAAIGKGAFLNSFLQNFVKDKFNLELEINGKLQNNIYCVRIANSSFSHTLFLQKKTILEQMNKSLESMDFPKISDIKFI